MKLRSSLVILAVLAAACSGGPSDREIRKAWSDFVASSRCSRNIEFTKVEIADVTRQETSATAIVEVEGRWTGPQPGMFELPTWNLGGPCDGFDPRVSGTRRVRRELSMRKYDSGWKLEMY